MPDTVESQVVRASIRFDPDREARLSALLQQEIDWGKVLEIAIQHEILPVVYQRLAPLKNSIEPQGWQAIRGAYLENATKNVFLSKTLIRLLELFSQEGLDAVALKGPAFAVSAYGDLAMRQFTDLDVLIHPGDFDRALQVLEAAGWIPDFPVQEREKSWLLRSENVLPLTRHREHLELHWDVAEKGVAHPLQPSHWWQGLQTVRLLDREVKTISPENTFLYLCLHGMKHGWHKLKYVVDPAYFCASYPNLDWSSVLIQACQAGLLRALGLSVALIQQYCGLEIPVHLRPCASMAGIRSMANRVDQRLRAHGPAMPDYETVQWIIQSRERVQDRLYYMLDQIFIPKQADWETVPLPAGLGFLYYGVRPARLIVKFGGAVLSTLKPRPKRS